MKIRERIRNEPVLVTAFVVGLTAFVTTGVINQEWIETAVQLVIIGFGGTVTRSRVTPT